VAEDVAEGLPELVSVAAPEGVPREEPDEVAEGVCVLVDVAEGLDVAVPVGVLEAVLVKDVTPDVDSVALAVKVADRVPLGVESDEPDEVEDAVDDDV